MIEWFDKSSASYDIHKGVTDLGIHVIYLLDFLTQSIHNFLYKSEKLRTSYSRTPHPMIYFSSDHL